MFTPEIDKQICFIVITDWITTLIMYHIPFKVDVVFYHLLHLVIEMYLITTSMHSNLHLYPCCLLECPWEFV